MATKNIKKILLNKDGDNFVADIENIENRITQNSSNLETAKQELTNKCNEALSEAKAYTDQEKAKYLPLTGGTVTDDVAINGALTVPNGLIRTNDTSKSINIRCTTDDKSGAKIVLNGKDAANNAGEFIITATDGTNSFDFCASPTGKLTYGDKNIVRSVNGTNADTQGNVQLDGLVKSVNGINADDNGNVNITAGENASGGLKLGDIGIAPLGIDETDNCRRYLNGQVILQSQFSKFTEKLKHAITLYPNLVTSEDNWQSAVTLSPLGQCGKFVIDDEAGTIRLPKVVNVMGALDLSTIGELQSAGLPNIKGSVKSLMSPTSEAWSISSHTSEAFTAGNVHKLSSDIRSGSSDTEFDLI